MSIDFDEILKGDVVNGAYSRLRINDLTEPASPEDSYTALVRLEMLGRELRSRNMDGGYNFERDPHTSSEAGFKAEYLEAYETGLALRLAPDFNINAQTLGLLTAQASQAMSNLAAREAQVRQLAYPPRMPRGSGQTIRYFPYSPFFNRQNRAVVDAPTLRLNEVNDFVENFASYLKENELIESHTITPDDGIVVVRSSVSGAEVRYRLRLDSINPSNEDDSIAGSSSSLAATGIDISITTSDGRVSRRRVQFNTLR